MQRFICGRVYNKLPLSVQFSVFSVVKNLTTENTEVTQSILTAYFSSSFL